MYKLNTKQYNWNSILPSFRAIRWNAREIQLENEVVLRLFFVLRKSPPTRPQHLQRMAHKITHITRLVLILSHSKILNSFSLELLSSKEKLELNKNFAHVDNLGYDRIFCVTMTTNSQLQYRNN